MADDRRDERGEEEQIKFTVRDRRRVSTEGLREVEDEAPAAAPAPPPAASEPQPAPPPQAAAPPTGQPRRGGALGGAEEARANRGSFLQEVDDIDDDDDTMDEPEGEAPRVTNVYEYVQVLASELAIWGIASLGLMAHPATRLVTTDLDQAEFAIEASEAMLQTLRAHNRIEEEQLIGVYQSFVVQFGSVAAQLLNQPAQTRLQEIRKIRFCIDTAERFAEQLGAVIEARGAAAEQTQLAEITRFLGELRLAYVQASGGGGIIG